MAKMERKLHVRHFERVHPGRRKMGFGTDEGFLEKMEKRGKMEVEAFLREIGPFGSGSAATSTVETRWDKTTLDQVRVPRCARCQELLPLRLAAKWPFLLLSLNHYN